MSANRNKNKRKKGGTLRWGNIVLVAVLAIIAGVTSFFLFAPSEEEEYIPTTLPPGVEYSTVYFHFPSLDLEGWGGEARQIELGDKDAMIADIIAGLAEGPRGPELAPSMPAGLSIEWLEFDELAGRVDISFCSNFDDMPSSERIILIGSFVYTLTELEFLDNLQFFVGADRGRPVFAYGDALRNRSNTSLGRDVPELTPIIVTLYFPDDMVMWLHPEGRSIPVDRSVAEQYLFVVEALIRGPITESLSPAISPDTTLNHVRRMGNTVFVDFTPNFISNFAGGTTAEQMMIFSLVNTITGMSGVTSVQFSVDGEPIPEDGSFHMDLSLPIERNEDLIWREEE